MFKKLMGLAKQQQSKNKLVRMFTHNEAIIATTKILQTEKIENFLLIKNYLTTRLMR